MEKTNTPQYKTKYLNHFRDFDPKKEKEELKKIKRSFNKNEDDIHDLPNINKPHFNNVTKTMQFLSKDEINDKIEAAEETEEKKESIFNESISSVESFMKMMHKDVENHLEVIEPLLTKTHKKDIDSYNQLLQIKKDLENIKHNIKNK
jgi:Mg2+ and Co2+ transporter CorA